MLAAIPSPPDPTLQLGPLELHWYGIVVAIGVWVAIVITGRRYERFGGDRVALEQVLLWAIGLGFLGARAGYVATHLDTFFGPDATLSPWQVIAIWEGGLAFFGGIIGGSIAAFVLLRRRDLPVVAFFDAAAIAVPVAQAIGRLGNWFNQELFGSPTDLPWGLRVSEAAAARAGFPDATTFHPTFLYEALLNLLAVALILWTERRHEWRRGSIFLLYVASYGVIRFLTELLRTDDQIEWFGLGIRNNGWIALLLFVVSAALLLRRERGDSDPLAPLVERDEALLATGDEAEPVASRVGHDGREDDRAEDDRGEDVTAD